MTFFVSSPASEIFRHVHVVGWLRCQRNFAFCRCCWWEVESIRSSASHPQPPPPARSLNQQTFFLNHAKCFRFSSLCHQIFRSPIFQNATATRVMNFTWISFPFSAEHCHLFLFKNAPPPSSWRQCFQSERAHETTTTVDKRRGGWSANKNW